MCSARSAPPMGLGAGHMEGEEPGSLRSQAHTAVMSLQGRPHTLLRNAHLAAGNHRLYTDTALTLPHPHIPSLETRGQPQSAAILSSSRR
ncbi:unnamed protein product [Boreogadus saida]